ncbi:MAG: Diadenosine tetraphosphate (Ap4A) hydrolase and other HIT family hydrolase [Parcubacteria group bacterium Gr01-1014_48]|nr:MAG: Diadenosine tetraphosphate (Ap4A) hydrolase and other HIT family hydrolase [Parcubacteria group bacterium Greene0416_14]TSC73759.1 MAG: Diadenosine tetraphosphate (Ap4A) hydrolase and other HIT family hydrolase [Parcubacteria group bacterium Gr01-1014_48]TSD01187.1 MAG: Diadenosine tetraphosphate (Ap4A) hydrolase and other HIT family hydrolase [Parcubacteria group bacterium Greene1014_15]TSD08192.1 MAG: Diadenosine tetraphosphate (Ap4A) hydrolase and other HIT family hydrolase [Parcubact
MEKECIFCKIAAGEIPSYTVFENKNFKAFLDIWPLNKGHVLVIPKKHYRWVWDVPIIGKYYEVVGMVANALRKALDTEWVTSLVIGEEVPHAHVWLVPRFKGDGHGGTLNFSKRKKLTATKMEEMQKQIVGAFK